MGRLWWLTIGLLWSPCVWADYHAVPTGRIDVGALTSEMKQLVPDLEGCDMTEGHLTCRRLQGDFSPGEATQLNAALLVHNPDIRAKQKQEEQSSTQEIPLSSFGGLAGGLAGAASLVIVARKKKGSA